MSDGGKGDKRRPRQISQYEEDLRWELIQCEDNERKEQILDELAKIQAMERLRSGPRTYASEDDIMNILKKE